MGSPILYSKWAAVAAVAGALERKVWSITTKGKIFPNHYILLVGPAGVGKTLATGEGTRPLLAELKDHYIGATNVSRASLIDCLYAADRRIVNPTGIESFHALTIVSNEFATFLPAYENDFMAILTDIWDGREFEEKKRGKDLHINMPKPTINLIAATTPSYLNGILPEGAWEQGFLSRCIIAYSGEAEVVDLWDFQAKDDRPFKDLTHDLKIIGSLFGEMRVMEEVKIIFMKWLKGGGEPRPDHPKLNTYSTRRPHHLLKLMMVMSAMRGNDLLISLEDYRRAMDLLVETEFLMPDVFKAMISGGDSNVIRDCWYVVLELFNKHAKKPVQEHLIIDFLSNRVPAHAISRVLETMVRMKILAEVIEPKIGKCYVPRPKSPHT